MSWFGKEFASLCSSDTHCNLGDSEFGLEAGDGVIVERRSVLKLSATAVAAALAMPQWTFGQEVPPKGKSTAAPDEFRRFLDEVYPLTQKLVATDGQGEAAYLMTVAAALSRLAAPGQPIRKAMRSFMKEHRDSGKRFPLSAVSMRLKPGGGFKPHDHRDYNGVIMGIEGECRIRNFDVVGDNLVPDEGTTFQVRQTADDLITPGTVSTLGRTKNNIHDLVAGKEGARVLDVFTFFKPNARSYFLNIESKPVDADLRLYEAAWKPSRRRRKKKQ